MGYINIYVGNFANLSIKNNQLVLSNVNKQEEYPIEDINSVMIESLEGSISTYALSQLAEYGILTFVCDQKHLPSGLLLPFCQHYTTLVNYNLQAQASKPLVKNLWQKVVVNKIENQNEVLNICGGHDQLKSLSAKVLSGDSSNVEAAASLVYFKELFDKDFKRREDSAINSFLNYGYAIVRGFVARSITIHGLMPFVGINHRNQFNQFNLADDLMEPFRPLVDLFVKIHLVDERALTPQVKGQIYSIINYDLEIDGQKQTLSNAIDIYVESFLKSLKNKTPMLKDVKITGLNLHKYE